MFGLKNVFQKWLLLQEIYPILMGQKTVKNTHTKKRKTLIGGKVLVMNFPCFTFLLYLLQYHTEQELPKRGWDLLGNHNAPGWGHKEPLKSSKHTSVSL